MEEKQNTGGKLTYIEELHRKRQNRKIRNTAALALVLAVLVFYFTGTYASAFSALAEAAESVQIFLNRSGSFPAKTGIVEPLQAEVLAGGFVELGQEDLFVYSATGTNLSSIQHGYARPAITTGNSRFCVYNRGGTELRVESRTRSLYSEKMPQNILLCQMSGNGSLAVVTQSTRYLAEMSVYPPDFGEPYCWWTTKNEGTPVRVAFADDNHRMAVGCISAKDGQLASAIYMLDTHKNTVTAVYQADAGSALLDLKWISNSQVLCIYDNFACVLNPSTGAELCRFSYGGAAVASVSVYGRTAALLLSTRSGSRLVVLNDRMNALLDTTVAAANRVTVTHNSVYLLRDGTVERMNLKGESQWVQSFDTKPQFLLNAEQLLLFVDSSAQVLAAPAAEK